MTWLSAASARRKPSTDEERNALVSELLSKHQHLFGLTSQSAYPDIRMEAEGEGGEGGEDKSQEGTGGGGDTSTQGTDDEAKKAAEQSPSEDEIAKATALHEESQKALRAEGEKALQAWKERARKAEASLKERDKPEDPVLKFQRSTARSALRAAAISEGFAYGKLINKLVDVDGIEFDADGDIDETEIAARVAQAKKDYPDLFKTAAAAEKERPARTPNGGGASEDDGKAKGRGTQAEFDKLVAQDADNFDKLVDDPRFKHLFGK